MPTIYDNDQNLLRSGLLDAYRESRRADCCVGYFNLRGWDQLADAIDTLPGDTINEKGTDIHRVCRILIGMMIQNHHDHWKYKGRFPMDNVSITQQRELLAAEFRRQLETGYPNNRDETILKQLRQQLIDNKVCVKLYLRSPLHAKLYLAHRVDTFSPIIAFLGSSNLTLAGLEKQGELNVDVVEQDAAQKLSDWFEQRWMDSKCVDITKELIEVLDESWAGQVRSPYEIFLKIAYHLSYEARMGLASFTIPENFKKELLDFQQTAVAVAARHLKQRNGVLVGDVVGLGKTIIATAIAKIFEKDFKHRTLIICPKNLTDMWEKYIHNYRITGKVISVSNVQAILPQLQEAQLCYETVIIDESHNLRNNTGVRYKAIKKYIDDNDSKVILLTATPYNKTYIDLANQLRLFLDEDELLTVYPEQYVRSKGGLDQFNQKHPTTHYRSLKAFELSDDPGDWQKLMQHYLVRRTRNFIKKHYAKTDDTGRKYLQFADGRISPFPDRVPKKAEFPFDSNDAGDQYARLYSNPVVEMIGGLHLARYGLQLYRKPTLPEGITDNEKTLLDSLNRAQRRLIGFCRTMLFKRLESSGSSFLLSLSRHLLRNYIFIYALKNQLPIPLGKNVTQNLDDYLANDEDNDDDSNESFPIITDPQQFLKQGEMVYLSYQQEQQKHDWIRSTCFTNELLTHLEEDSQKILSILSENKWKPNADRKLNALYGIITKTHGNEKVLIFTQFADTAMYLHKQLVALGATQIESVTGGDNNPMQKAYRFSPESNQQSFSEAETIRVLITTDVLSEGQNLQDCRIVVNYDLPWAIIRLIQRAGRVDRIGQKATEILCYSFFPEEGIENIINLRGRLKTRIKEYASVIGSDEQFFEDDPINLADLYNEKSGIFDDAEDDAEVDIGSHALKIWQEAIEKNPTLEEKIKKLPNVVHSAKQKNNDTEKPGAIVYLKTAADEDMLVQLDENGEIITLSQMEILKAAECTPQTAALEKLQLHNDLIACIIERIKNDDQTISAALGTRLSIKRRVYERLERYCQNNLLASKELKQAVQDIHNYKMMETAKESFIRQIKADATDEQLAEVAENQYNERRLVFKDDINAETKEPEIICSLGLR